MEQRSLFGLAEHLERLSAHGDPLEVLERTVDFAHFRGWLVEGLGYGGRSKGERPPFDPVSTREIWPDEPAKAAQKDVSARWTLKIGSKPRYRPDGTPLPMIVTPVFGYKSHISIDRKFGFIRESAASHADGRMLKHLVTTANTSGEVWADSAYRSQKNETWLAEKMLTSRIHRRRPAGKPMPEATARANAKKSSVRARVEHVFFGVRHCACTNGASMAHSSGPSVSRGPRRN